MLAQLGGQLGNIGIGVTDLVFYRLRCDYHETVKTYEDNFFHLQILYVGRLTPEPLSLPLELPLVEMTTYTFDDDVTEVKNTKNIRFYVLNSLRFSARLHVAVTMTVLLATSASVDAELEVDFGNLMVGSHQIPDSREKMSSITHGLNP